MKSESILCNTNSYYPACVKDSFNFIIAEQIKWIYLDLVRCVKS